MWCYAGSGLAKILSDAQKLSSGGAGRIQTRRRRDAKTQSSRRLRRWTQIQFSPPEDTDDFIQFPLVGKQRYGILAPYFAAKTSTSDQVV